MKNKLQFMLVLFLIAGILFTSAPDVQAATKKQLLNITDISLSVGQSRKLTVSYAKNVKWSSSEKSVVSVDKKGNIKAKKSGKATITAKVGKKQLKCNVVVRKASAKKKDVLVVYFSQTGTTQSVAKKIQNLTGGDLLRIREKDKYTSDYDSLTKIAKKELNKNVRPKITTEARNIKSYDVIYIGYPIWWGKAPRVVNTFLEKCNLKGKTVIPFCTSGGSTIGASIPDLKKSCKGASFKKGYTADTGSTSEIRKWLTDIGELKSTSKPVPKPEPSEEGKILVAYFSWSGTSERIAKNIIEQTGADSFRIERETPYSTDYNTTAYGDAKTEAETNARPPIKDPLSSVSQYSKIVICYPIWWHTAPMTVGTFLEKYDLSGKNIYPISQSASMDVSQYEQSVSFIRECAKGAVVDNGIFSKDNSEIQAYITDKVLH